MQPEVLAWAAVAKPLIWTGVEHAGDPADWGQEVRSIRRTSVLQRQYRGTLRCAQRQTALKGGPWL